MGNWLECAFAVSQGSSWYPCHTVNALVSCCQITSSSGVNRVDRLLLIFHGEWFQQNAHINMVVLRYPSSKEVCGVCVSGGGGGGGWGGVGGGGGGGGGGVTYQVSLRLPVMRWQVSRCPPPPPPPPLSIKLTLCSTSNTSFVIVGVALPVNIMITYFFIVISWIMAMARTMPFDQVINTICDTKPQMDSQRNPYQLIEYKQPQLCWWQR